MMLKYIFFFEKGKGFSVLFLFFYKKVLKTTLLFLFLGLIINIRPQNLAN